MSVSSSEAEKHMALQTTLSKFEAYLLEKRLMGSQESKEDFSACAAEDEYPMPVVDQLVDGASGHKVLSFMDGHSGYNQIFIDETDTAKTAFRCPGALRTFEWVVMPFSLKNAGASFQRAMNAIFHDFMFDLKVNLLKCAFGVVAGKFLGFLVHNRGIEVDKNKAKAIMEAKPPTTKKELQKLLGSFNFLRRFISNLAGRVQVFSPLLKLKDHDVFVWEANHQKAFDEIKGYLATAPVLMPPIKNRPLKLYISAAEGSIGGLLAQDNAQGKQQAVYYLSRLLTPCERRSMNTEANSLAQASTGLKLAPETIHKIITIQKKLLPSVRRRGLGLEIFTSDFTGEESDDEPENDWRTPIISFLKRPHHRTSRKVRRRAMSYILVGHPEAMRVMSEVHEGICGAHQSGIKMRWLIRRYGYYWPTILKDCIRFSKGCQPCQAHGPIQRVPAADYHAVVKPWPFRGWALDVIGKIYPPSSGNHTYILVATDYFTKWAEAVPLKSVDQQEVIKVIKERIIHRFGLPEHLVADRGTIFMGEQVVNFAAQQNIIISNSTPYYAQGNGQTESTNRTLVNTVEKMVKDNLRAWHELLSEALWAYRTSKKEATNITPYMLVYGHDPVLPMEVAVKSTRIAYQNGLTSADYTQAMLMELEDLDEVRLAALDHMLVQKRRVARSYDKRVRKKSFTEVTWFRRQSSP
ncbi:uncharacterized protein LOC131328539 [Rhododendron vialii]|uniref:uncharacterized protein LOC131328539 n=1 Tax=Rhododendron vialii TaxID=182163 RepID=UPI00265F0FBB|nr:uncharacterized protein LOC131328539 [Rhododendron vialii]